MEVIFIKLEKFQLSRPTYETYNIMIYSTESTVNHIF